MAEAASSLSVAESVAEGVVLERHPYSRMAWRRTAKGTAQIFANGRDWACESADDAARICAATRIDAHTLGALSPAGRALVQQLAEAGHYAPMDEDGACEVEDDGLYDEGTGDDA